MITPSAAIPLAWPDMSVRAAESVFHWLRKMGIMKNQNILVGHAAILIAEGDSLTYYDFGRYTSPNGQGRARCAWTDPKLQMETKPQWDDQGNLCNMEAIAWELESMAEVTHGEHSLYASILKDVDVVKTRAYCTSIIERGYMPYNGLTKNTHNNCARFVAKAILAGLEPGSKMYKRYKWPVSFAPSPYSNVATAMPNGKHFRMLKGKGSWHHASLMEPVWDICRKAYTSFSISRSKQLPSDAVVTYLKAADVNPATVPESSVYLGGTGEGCFYHAEVAGEALSVTRFSYKGDQDYQANYKVDEKTLEAFRADECHIVHDSHLAWITLQYPKTGSRIRCRKIT